MSELSYVCLYLDYYQTLDVLSDVALGKLIRAMLRFAISGEEPVLTGSARCIWPILRNQISRDQAKYREKCEKNRRNGAKGGKTSRKPTQSERLPTGAKEKKNNNNNDNDIDIDIDIDIDNDTDIDIDNEMNSRRNNERNIAMVDDMENDAEFPFPVF